MTGYAPYNGLDEAKIRARYLNGEFPDTTSLQEVGTVIKKCWQGNYFGSDIVVDDLKGIFFQTQ